MSDIFISYSRHDLDMVKVLAHTLEESGYSVWWDVSGLHGGQSFASVIQQQLNEAKCAIVIWSPDSVVSNWVNSEATLADQRGILLTAMYRESHAPVPFNNRHNENLRNWNGDIFDDGFQKLLKAISAYCPEPSGKPHRTGRGVEAGLNGENTAGTKSSTTTKSSESSGFFKKLQTTAVIAGLAVIGYFYLNSTSTEEAQRADNPDTGESQKVVAVGKEASDSRGDSQAKPQKETMVDTVVLSANKPDSSNTTKPLDVDNAKAIDTTSKNEKKNISDDVSPDSETNDLLNKSVMQYHLLAEEGISKQQFKQVEGHLKNSAEMISKFSLSDNLKQKQAELSKALKAAELLAAEEEKKKVLGKNTYELPNNLTLLPIPAGSFLMGSNHGDSNEKPVHRVTFSDPFWISKTEITFDQYDEFAAEVGKMSPDDRGWGRADRPVMNVSWNDAQEYVKWISENNTQGLQCRLPSEAEWEYVARADSKTKYFWGDEIGENNANCAKCGSQWDYNMTSPVASFSENKWGIHDMHGNVREWVQDPWHGNYEDSPKNGEVWQDNGDTSRRVVRGGSWSSSPDLLRSAFRSLSRSPDNRNYDLGFRIVCSSH